MDAKGIVLKEFVKNGYAKENGKRVWNIANRSLLHLTPELSNAFLGLINFDVYRKNIFNKEVKLIRDNIDKFIEKIGVDVPFNLIDIGCGDGTKAKEFIRAIKGRVKVRYCPVSPDDYLINIAIKNIKDGNFKNVTFKHHKAVFEKLQDVAPILRSNEFQKNIILLHGSILASYEINNYLFHISRGMHSGSFMIIGNGIRSGRRLVNINNYRHRVFNDWFIHLMRIIGFNDDEIEYDAKFRNTRMESFYRIKVDKIIKHNGKDIKFKKGDEIVVFMLYKYYMEELEKFLKMYFCDVDIVKDEENEYILALCKK